MQNNGDTMKFDFGKQDETEAGKVILTVYEALQEGGYNPIDQFVGYIMSGDPTYITNHKNARSIIKRLERDELIEELIKKYVSRD